MLRRGPFACLVLIALAAPACSGGEAASDQGRIATRRIEAPAFKAAVGADVRFEGGLVLSSDAPRFGGLSGLWLDDDGSQAIAVSDRHMGFWRFQLVHGDAGRLVGVDRVEPAFGEGPEWQWNAEALAPAGPGALAVAHEGKHRVERVPVSALLAAPQAPWPLPPALSDRGNQGIEALATLPDGSLIALAEAFRTPAGDLAGWILREDGFEPLGYARTGAFAPTGADVAGGWLFVVERSFELLLGGFSARVVRVPLGEIRPGARLEGEEVLRLPTSFGDNFEALEAETTPDGRIRLYLMTDDNFVPLQRTVLLQVSLRGDG